MALERAARIVLIVSLSGAGLLFARIAGPPLLAAIIGLAAVAGWCAGRYGFSAVVLVVGYVVPIVLLLIFGEYYEPYLVVWMAALFGVVLSRPPYASWSLPQRWRAPLLFWALVVALSWPVVVLRELDFTPGLLNATRGIGNSHIGGLPADVVTWVLSVAITHGVGLLWLDRLCADFSRADLPRFERMVVLPLGVSAAVGSLVSIYQAVFNLQALSRGAWASQGRAAGPLVDANPSGFLMALWIFGLLALASRVPNRSKIIAGIGGLLAFGGAWASGSRSVLLVLMIGMAGVSVAAWRKTARPRPLMAAGTVGALLLFGAGLVWFSARAGSENPIRRLLSMVPRGTANLGSIQHGLIELWERNNYGVAAMEILRDSPFVGAGVGAFHILSSDYAAIAGLPLTPSDNAQNWYRHQFAELGAVGSAGWVGWMVLFVPVLVCPPRDREQAFALTTVRSLIIAVAVVSLFGMPTQNAVVALTFWTLAFWCLQLADPPEPPKATRSLSPRILLLGVWILAFAHLGGTMHVATTTLRVPSRALRAHWIYRHGFSDQKLDSDGQEFRETGQRAVEVFPTSNQWLKLTVWIDHPDAQRDPVEIKLWRNRELILRTIARDSTRITRYVQVPHRERQLMIETWVERTWQPAGQQPRGLHVANWEWLDRPPRNAAAVVAADSRTADPPRRRP